MRVVDLAEVRDVSATIQQVFDVTTLNGAQDVLRRLFVELLDFSQASGVVPLGADGLPPTATRLAQRAGVQVVSVQVLEKGRVLKQSLDRVLAGVRKTLAGDVLLLATDADQGQWHVVYPSTQGGREVLRRMVLHRGQGFRTVAEQVAGIYRDLSEGLDLRTALDRAYDVEAVTKRFFQAYADTFKQVMELLQGLPNEEERKLFCQTLFNRLMFLYFLQRKGWLRFKGRIDYLDVLWDEARKQPGENFYEIRLKLLFFTALSTSRSDNSANVQATWADLIGDVPFLNGGLFSEQDLDKRFGIRVPNDAIEAILRELFARFNFTITESTPYDLEVAVDPEMLGKVFEQLVTGRHETGSYYTPRPIVSFMCREALKGYLRAEVADLSKDDAGAFVDDYQVRGLSVSQARHIIQALGTVTVVDPACGSGAYLLGMLHELVELQQLLYSSALLGDPKSLYELKLRVIEHNVYGADVDYFAVNIAMLRLWLSLAIEYDGARPEPLPNLDFKIVCGDSLSAPDPNPALEPELFRRQAHEDAAELIRLKGEYLRETGNQKHQFSVAIEEKRAQLANLLNASAPHGSVDWRLEFPDVFDAGGFNIVVANPPYVSAVGTDPEIGFRDRLRGRFSTARGAFDLFIPFYQLSVELLAQHGIAVLITPNKLLGAEYAMELRRWLNQCGDLLQVADLSKIRVFSAGVYPIVTLFQKLTSTDPGRDSVVSVWRATEFSGETAAVAYSHSADAALLRATPDSNWTPVTFPIAEILQSLLVGSERFGDLVNVSGAATVEEAYDWKDAVTELARIPPKAFRSRYLPFVVSGNIIPFGTTWNTARVRYLGDSYRQAVLDSTHSAISLRRRGQMRSKKVIVSGLAIRPRAHFDADGIAAGKSTVLILPGLLSLRYVTLALNSLLYWQIYRLLYGSLALGSGYFRFGPPQIRALPVKRPTLAQAIRADEIVDELQTLGASGDLRERERLLREAEVLVCAASGVDLERLLSAMEHAG